MKNMELGKHAKMPPIMLQKTFPMSEVDEYELVLSVSTQILFSQIFLWHDPIFTLFFGYCVVFQSLLLSQIMFFKYPYCRVGFTCSKLHVSKDNMVCMFSLRFVGA